MPHFRLNNEYYGSTILLASSSVFLRVALGVSFLSAVADRFGLWGAFGEPHVAWGTFARFVAYTAQLTWFLPRAAAPSLAIVSTCAETLLGILRRVADADDSSAKWRLASAVCRRDDRSSRDQGALGRLRLLSKRRSVSSGRLHRIPIQYRSAATKFAAVSPVTKTIGIARWRRANSRWS